MVSRRKYGELEWIDLESPTHKEVQDLVNEFSLTHLVGEELLLPSTKPRVEFYPNYSYIILHFPALHRSRSALEQELDFVIGKKFIITTHYDAIDPLHKFSKVFEVNSILGKGGISDHAGFLFFYMLKHLYRGVEHEIDHTRRSLYYIEEHIFSGHEVEMVKAISRVARDLLNLRQTIEPHREVLRTLESDGSHAFGEEFAPYLRALASEYYRIHNHIVRNTDSLHELRETNNSLLSTKENETMRVLTIMALLTFPLALFVALFDMDAVANPILGNPYDFWIVVALVFVLGSMMLWYFRHKKWL